MKDLEKISKEKNQEKINKTEKNTIKVTHHLYIPIDQRKIEASPSKKTIVSTQLLALFSLFFAVVSSKKYSLIFL